MTLSKHCALNPVVLIGSGRSGTTLVANMFKAIPDCAVWHEPRTVWNAADPARPHDRFLASDATAAVKRFVRNRMAAYQRRAEASVLFEKTPANALRVPFVEAVLPEARFIHLVRHPISVIRSSESVVHWRPGPGRLARRIRETPLWQLPYYARALAFDVIGRVRGRRSAADVWGIRYPGILDDIGRLGREEILARQWCAAVQTAREDLDVVLQEKVLHVRYEDLMSSPQDVVSRMLSHARVSATDNQVAKLAEMVDASRRSKWLGGGDCAPFRAEDSLKREASRWGYRLDGLVEEGTFPRSI